MRAEVVGTAGGPDPMVANPMTGTIYLAWVQPAATDAATATGDAAAPSSGRVLLARLTDGRRTFGGPVVTGDLTVEDAWARLAPVLDELRMPEATPTS